MDRHYNYCNLEFVAMVQLYARADYNSHAARRLYAESQHLESLRLRGVKNPQVPTARTIVAVTQRLIEHGQFVTPGHAMGRGRTLFEGRRSGNCRSPSPKPSTPRSSSRGTTSKDSTPKVVTTSRKDSVSALATKTRKESGSSHASTDTPSIKSDKDYDRRRDSRDSNASGPRDGSTSRKSTTQRDKTPKTKVSSVGAWDSPLIEEDGSSRRGRRRANTSTPPATTPAKRRRT